ncbi:hypothetical protein K0B04_02640 [Patescibacteria group bacterium]|nr:hypothetical protein [Patescibacteria group bacterium]
MTKLEILQKTGLNVFTPDDLMVLWQSSDKRSVHESVKDYIRRERMFSIRRGIYLLNKEYDTFELAQKLISPSYISHYTALAYHGIIFQKYSDIHSFASYYKSITVDGKKFIYHKLKEEIFNIQDGLLITDKYTIAGPERAICDTLYLNKSIAFDNLRNIDTSKLKSISQIYNNKRLEDEVNTLILRNKLNYAG